MLAHVSFLNNIHLFEPTLDTSADVVEFINVVLRRFFPEKQLQNPSLWMLHYSMVWDGQEEWFPLTPKEFRPSSSKPL